MVTKGGCYHQTLLVPLLAVGIQKLFHPCLSYAFLVHVSVAVSSCHLSYVLLVSFSVASNHLTSILLFLLSFVVVHPWIRLPTVWGYNKGHGYVIYDLSKKAEVFSIIFQNKQSDQVLNLPLTCFSNLKFTYFAVKSSETKNYLKRSQSWWWLRST